MKKLFGILFDVVLLLALVVIVPHAQALADTAAVTASPTSSDIHEIDYATPGTRKVQLGTRLRGILQTGATKVTTTNTRNNQTCGVGGANAVFVSPFTSAYIETQTAFGDSVCLGDGYQGEEITFVLVTGKQTFSISPATKTGFANISMTASNAAVTLKYQDSTDGWTIDGSTASGVTVN